MILFLLYLLLPTFSCFFVEINLHGKNDTRSLKLLCGPPSENMNLKYRHKVLWYGSEFGNDDRQRLAGDLEADSLVPNLSIKSSNRHLCYLIASEDFEGNQTAKRRRVSRNSIGNNENKKNVYNFLSDLFGKRTCNCATKHQVW